MHNWYLITRSVRRIILHYLAFHSWIGHGESISRSALLSGAFHVRWPTIYSARYLSSFPYRLSGEHLRIIKRRYLSRHTRLTVDPLSMRLSSGCYETTYFGGKKCYKPAMRILHELPTRYRSRHSRRVRQVLEFGFRRGPVCPPVCGQNALVLDDFPRSSLRRRGCRRS